MKGNLCALLERRQLTKLDPFSVPNTKMLLVQANGHDLRGPEKRSAYHGGDLSACKKERGEAERT